MPNSETTGRTSALTRVARSRGTRFTAATVAVGLAAGAVVTAGGGTASAATPIRAQSVGRFLDGATGGMALQTLVDLKDARAKAAPNTSKRQGVNAELFGAGEIPIGNALKLPGGGVFNLGASNQIAVAKTNGYSYGASGAVENNGGIQLTDKNGQYPSDAKINISGAALGNASIPGLGSLPTTIPGLPSGASNPINAATLGGVVAKVGAVQALAQTGAGGKTVKPQSSVADLQLAIGSPALGALLTQLKSAFGDNLGGSSTGLLGGLLGGLPGGGSPSLPSKCALTSPTAKSISLEGGGVVLDVNNAKITVDLAILLKKLLGVNIAHLSTSNFDLVKFLVQNLPTILSKGLENVVTGLTTKLANQFKACANALTNDTPLAPILSQLTSALSSLQTQLISGINTIADPLIKSSASPLATLADGLTGVVDIGLNVQSGPKIQPHNTDYKYSTQLAKTPDQATKVVKHQSLVRAIEIDLLDASAGAASGGLPSGGLPTLPSGLPGTNAAAVHQLAGAHQAAAASGDSVVSLALGNAAAGPSVAAPTVTTTTTTPSTPTTTPGTNIPTGVPAGAAGHNDGGSPLLPAALLLLGLAIAGGGVLSFRMRGRFTR